MSIELEEIFWDSIVDNVIVLDKEGKIIEVNQALLNLLGYKKKEDLITLPMEKIYNNFSLKELKDKIPMQGQEVTYLNRDGGGNTGKCKYFRQFKLPGRSHFYGQGY